jgi:hypothetical protein
MSDPTTIDTGGGASVGRDVQAARDFVGRDQLNISVHLKNVNDAAQVTRTIATALSKGDLESESIRADLLSLMEELRRTHSTIVKAISPLRRIKDDETTFENDFKATYNDFRDFYDAYDFWEERTHCHKISQILQRLEKHHTPITQTPEWDQLRRNLEALSDADGDLIERYYRPFMQRFNDVMVKINQHVNGREIGQAITLKQVFLDELTAQYDGIKDMLRVMTSVIANIEESLA